MRKSIRAVDVTNLDALRDFVAASYTTQGVLDTAGAGTRRVHSRPRSLVPVIAERWAWYDAVDELEPSFFVDGEIPPVYPDHFVARVCAVGALALLIRREHTASGGALSVSQAESILNVMPEFFLSASMNGDVKPDPKVDLADFPHFSDAF